MVSLGSTNEYEWALRDRARPTNNGRAIARRD
jgi:hypothetical protein